MKIKPPLRTKDSQGEGHYGASRGARTHKGIDLACYEGSIILSLTDGVVTKLGYPYNPNNHIKGHLRYVQITFEDLDYRYFYVQPLVKVGDKIKAGDEIGITQGLVEIYPGITDHFHFEIKKGKGYLNPEKFI